MKYGAAILEPDTPSSIVDDLLPGAHAVLFGDADSMVRFRSAGLQVRDTALLMTPGPTTSTVILLRKPIDAIVDQVLSTGTGALHIDAVRVGSTGGTRKVEPERYKTKGNSLEGSADGSLNGGVKASTGTGRWPPNLMLVHGSSCRPSGVKTAQRNVRLRFNDSVSSVNCYGDGLNNKSTTGSTETVITWDCEAGCPVPPLGETTRFYPQFSSRDEAVEWLISLILPPGALLFR